MRRRKLTTYLSADRAINLSDTNLSLFAYHDKHGSLRIIYVAPSVLYTPRLAKCPVVMHSAFRCRSYNNGENPHTIPLEIYDVVYYNVFLLLAHTKNKPGANLQTNGNTPVNYARKHVNTRNDAAIVKYEFAIEEIARTKSIRTAQY